MKKAFILTSILALAACSNGGGEYNPGHTHGSAGHSTVSTPVFVPVPSANESLTVDPENANITGMASSTITNEAAVRASMVSYVLGKMPGIYTNDNLTAMLPRGASNRNLRDGDELTDEQKFFIANKKLTAMKATLNAMASADDLEAYIDANQASVAEALLLFGQDIDLQDIDPTVLLADFNAIVEGTDIVTAIETFEAAQSFVYDTAMLDTVRFQDAGDANAYFKFNLDGDEIDKVAMFEGNEVNDYGWFTKTANESGNEFGKTFYGYKFTMGAAPTTAYAPLDETYTEEQQLAAFAWYNDTTGHDDVNWLKIKNDLDGENLTNADKRNAMIAKLNAEIDDFKDGQHDNTNYDKIELMRAYYLAKIDEAFGYGTESWNANGKTVVLGQTITPLNWTVTMNGLGKDLGLKYSDLGYAAVRQIELTNTGTKISEQYAPYSGGYTERVIDPGDTTATYTGTAIAGVEWKTQDVEGDKDGDGMLLTDTGAQLVYNNGVSTLTMNNLRNSDGEKWYGVTVSGSEDTGLNFTFDATGKTTDEAFDFLTAPNEVAFANENWNESEQLFQKASGTEDIDYRGSASEKYYGAMDEPTEAGVVFHFSEEQHIEVTPGQETHHEVGIYGAFGGTK